ncbi:something about silencing protein 10 isoform X2 [Clupea harengus]|uniref:Something about silencing protein 10 isoform X2 n=1 Tax=Clupea harengus TaxID=7950 RepID=A0A6P8FJM7_CLUHA|nr:something about silencing protein 10 isoform X2 [Clupea harengus]
MVRARRTVRKPKATKTEQYDSDDPDAEGGVPDKRSSKYMEDKVDEYHNAKIKKLLADGVQEDSDQEELDEEDEVMPLEVPDSGEEEEAAEEDEDMDSDLEGKNYDDLPSDMAWGHRKKMFYDTDYVTDKGKSKEEVAAEDQEEEEEAKNIQRRLAADLSEEDYDLNLLQEFAVQEEASRPVEKEEHIVKDLKEMSQKEKMKLLRKESPELLELIQDFKAKLAELKDEIQPLVEMVKDGRIPAGKGANYLLTKQQLYLHYCTNISFYLVLKAKRVPAHHHPVIERLVTYRNLINELGTVDARLAPQLRQLLSGTNRPAGTKPAGTPSETKIERAEGEGADSEEDSDSDLDEEAALKFYRGVEEGLKRKRQTTASSTAEGADEEEEAEDEGLEGDAKRGITYQMAKNKGLTPKRKKIDRNPRVKHREKFRRAQVRRKGQVQQVQRELTRYSGEMSGIRAGVKKSVKLK